MNILAGLESYLYVLASALFGPVIAGLVFLTLWVTVFFGGFLREAIERRRGLRPALSRYRKRLEGSFAPAEAELELERLLQGAELELIRGLDRIRFVIRVGPALGLMGTLIPMGIALSSLAQGDMPKMAGSMVTAFTTVVVGLACSVAAYLMSLAKEKWIQADLREMAYWTDRALGEARDGQRSDGKGKEAGHALS